MGYKRHYEGKLPYKFKQIYDPEKMTASQIANELFSIRLLVNSEGAPLFLKDALSKIGGFVELCVLYFGSDLLSRPISFGKTVEEQVARGEYDGEIQQLAIEWQEWL